MVTPVMTLTMVMMMMMIMTIGEWVSDDDA